MKNKKSVAIFSSGFFLLIDQFLKWLSLGFFYEPILLHKFFGWQPFRNHGVAFGIPLPYFLTIIFTIIILAAVIYLLWRESPDNLFSIIGLSLIIGGAISNLIDRLYLGATIDYLLIFTAIINLADIIIILGFALYIFSWRKK